MVIQTTLETFFQFKKMCPELNDKKLLKYERLIFYFCCSFVKMTKIKQITEMYSVINQLEKGKFIKLHLLYIIIINYFEFKTILLIIFNLLRKYYSYIRYMIYITNFIL